ncbi:hypothetical protein, partial [Klebsiella pneumoniae]
SLSQPVSCRARAKTRAEPRRQKSKDAIRGMNEYDGMAASGKNAAMSKPQVCPDTFDEPSRFGQEK